MDDDVKNVHIHKRERKTDRLNVRMSNSDMELLNKLSYESDESMSQIIRKAIRTYVKERQEKK